MLQYSNYQAINQWKCAKTNISFDSGQPLLAASRVCWFLNSSVVHYSKRHPPLILRYVRVGSTVITAISFVKLAGSSFPSV